MKSQHKYQYLVVFLTLTVIGFSRLNSVQALELTLEPPGDREFVRDLAGMIDEPTKKQIQEICDKLLTDKATPIIVVTIDHAQPSSILVTHHRSSSIIVGHRHH